jgi:hypothetical protein
MSRSALEMQGNIAISGTFHCTFKPTLSLESNNQISGTQIDRLAFEYWIVRYR